MSFIYNIVPGSTDVSVVCRAVDSTDGTPETAFDHATSGIDLKYRREGAANVDITEAALAALTTAHTDGGVEQIGNGYFRLDLPDAAVASGVSGVMVHGTATGMVIIGCYIQLEGAVNSNYARIGAPAGASVSADVAAVKSDSAAILVDTGTTLDGRIPAALVGGRMDASVGAMAANVLTASAINADAITAAKLAADVTTELQSGLATAASIAALNNLSAAQVNTEVDTALSDIRLDELLAADSDIDGAAPPTVGSVFHELMTKTAGSFTYDQTTDSLEAVRDRGDAAWITATGFSTLDAAGVRTAVGLASANLDTQLDALPTNAELATALGTADDAVLAAIAALNNLSAAQVNAEVVDALATDTYAEPAQGSPGATIALSAKINYLYKAWRNRSTQTATEYALYADDGTTKDHEAPCSDDATTFVRGEVTTGA